MKETLGKRILINTIIFTIFIFSLEMIVKINTHPSSIISWSTLRILISSIGISLILGFFMSLFNKIGRKVYISIVSVLLTIYVWTEINLYHYMGFFMGVGNAEQGTKILDYVKDFIAAARWTSYLVIIPLIILMVYIWYLQKILRKNKLNKTIYFKFQIDTIKMKRHAIYLTIVSLAAIFLMYYATLKVSFMQNKTQSIKNSELILTSTYANQSVSQFGVLVYGASDIIITTFDINIDLDTDTNVSYNGNKYNNQTPEDKKRTIDDTAWNNVINNENNTNYNKLNNYFINREITPKNDYTGMFKDKNLIVILLESVNLISINEKEYPNIYKLYSEGISYRNNYSPRNNCNTGNNEMTAMTSLFTINNTCTADKYKNNVYPEAIFNMFKNAGYTTSSYHDYADFYYSRKIIHPNMGSSNYYNASRLNIKWSSLYAEWPSDVDLIKTATPHFINEDKFMVFMTSVTTHQPYTVSSEYGDKHLSEFSEYNYSTAVKRYMSKMKELDAAIGLLLETLETSGKLDDTVIAVFGDHYPYGLTNKDINTVLDYDVNVDKEVDRTPMIIYNSATPKEEITKYTTMIDLLPTLLNMFDIDYNPRLYLGHDTFSEYDDRAVFSDGSWQDAKGYYNASTGKFTPKEETNTYTDDELIEINNEINVRQKMSALAIRTDYFNYLGKALDSEKQKLLEETNKEPEIKESEVLNGSSNS